MLKYEHVCESNYSIGQPSVTFRIKWALAHFWLTRDWAIALAKKIKVVNLYAFSSSLNLATASSTALLRSSQAFCRPTLRLSQADSPAVLNSSSL